MSATTSRGGSGSSSNALLRMLHLERQARAAAAPTKPPLSAGDASGAAPPAQAVAQELLAAVKTWSAADVSGCTHGTNTSCVRCCDKGGPVFVCWAVHAALDGVFARVGAMPAAPVGAARELVAGEVTWQGLHGMLRWAGARAGSGEAFLDCGAGHGRAVAAYAALYGPAHGVEIRPDVAQTGAAAVAAVLARLQQRRQEAGSLAIGGSGSGSSRGSGASGTSTTTGSGSSGSTSGPWPGTLVCGDMFAETVCWDAPLLLVNATGFDASLVARCVLKIEQDAAGLAGEHSMAAAEGVSPVGETGRSGGEEGGQGRPAGGSRTSSTSRRKRGRRALVLSQPLDTPVLELEGTQKFRVSWGVCTVYLYSIHDGG